MRNRLRCGDSRDLLNDVDSESVGLVFTSPPYYNSKPEYSSYNSYDSYLGFLMNVFNQCHRVLEEGRFFVLNISPVLLKREKRSKSSKRLSLPFDIHPWIRKLGFDFVDDIIWMKPEGAGLGRGRNFHQLREPLAYKPTLVTEYLLVYRKETDKLIDWNLKKDKDRVRKSLVIGDYEHTNVWRINPVHNPAHPAVFPKELSDKVLKYYSLVGDVVLDPFAGIGTVGHSAVDMHRMFILMESNPDYFVKAWDSLCLIGNLDITRGSE